MKVFVTIALVGTLLVACQKQTETVETQTRTVELNNCGTDGGNSNAEICFTELNDSRCPINANCVWQGVAVAKFTLRFDSTQHQVVLASAKFPGYPSTDTTIGGYKVKLVNVTPYPGSASNEPTRATLEITR